MLTFWWGFLGIFSKLIIIDISLETREPFHGQSCRFGCFVSLMKDFCKGGSNIGLNWELCCNFRRLRVHSQGSVMRDDLTDRRRPSGSHPKQISHEPHWGSRSGSVLANQPLSRYPTPQHHHLAAEILLFFSCLVRGGFYRRMISFLKKLFSKASNETLNYESIVDASGSWKKFEDSRNWFRRSHLWLNREALDIIVEKNISSSSDRIRELIINLKISSRCVERPADLMHRVVIYSLALIQQSERIVDHHWADIHHLIDPRYPLIVYNFNASIRNATLDFSRWLKRQKWT